MENHGYRAALNGLELDLGWESPPDSDSLFVLVYFTHCKDYFLVMMWDSR